jgi:hypothetical protein
MTQRITSEEAAALTKQVSSTQISAWNAAGTWEERGHTDWARARERGGSTVVEHLSTP